MTSTPVKPPASGWQNAALILLLFLLLFTAAIAGGLWGGLFAFLASPVLHRLWRNADRARTGESDPLPQPVLWGSVAAGGLAVALVWHSGADQRPVSPPRFEQLEVTTGVLLKGVGGERSIRTQAGRFLVIICADKMSRGPDNWCLYDRERPAIGKQVTVFHTPPFRLGRAKAHYYELRQGDARIVRYEDVAAHIASGTKLRGGRDRNLAISLTAMWAYLLMVTLWRAKANRWCDRTRSRAR